MNSTAHKNELIFNYSCGNLGEAKSLFVSMYLFLNNGAAKKSSIFNNILAEGLNDIENVAPKNLKYTDCIKNSEKITEAKEKNLINPISDFLESLINIKWKKIYKGFMEHSLPIDDRDSIKLIKMAPGTSVPLHSHNGKEYILVLDGSFCDEYGEYNRGDMQINDHQIKHNPIACNKNGCICLTIAENDIVFFGKYGSFLNLFTFIKSFLK